MKGDIASLLLHPSRHMVAILTILLLAACTGDELKNAAAGTAKSWCGNAANCTVHEER